MKKYFGFILSCFLLISLIGCSKATVKEQDIEKFIKQYKIEQYTVADPNSPPDVSNIEEKVSKYLSKDLQEKHHLNRLFQIAPEISKKTKKSIELEDVELKKVNENNDGTINYHYTLKIKFYDEKASNVVEKKGNLTISKNDELKIIQENEERDTKIGNEIF